MKFDRAIIRNLGVERMIETVEIAKQPDYLSIIKNLYCPIDGCTARLVLNRRSTGKSYLSKHKSYQHSETCFYFTEEEKSVNSITKYTEMNGGISENGISRRKSEGLKSLEEYLFPHETQKNLSLKKKNQKIKRDKTSGNIKQGIRINYVPNEQIVLDMFENNGFKIKEPNFYERLPHQISEKDSYKNLRTAIMIEKITLNTNKKYGEIQGMFENTYITFVLPEAFFYESDTRVNASDLSDYLNILKDYVDKNPKGLYLVTLCQSQKIDLDNLQLFIWQSSFMCFYTKNRVKLHDLRNLVLSIITKHI